jgi:UDP-2,3-diacylglucosamine hydrolase
MSLERVEMTDKIGIVAGGGQFPLLFAEAAKRQGKKVVVVANKGETWPELERIVDRLYWIKLGQLGKLIKYFKIENVCETVFLGTITKTRMFKDIRPDIKGMTLLSKIDVKQDDALLRAVAGELEKEGIKVLESTLYLQHLLFPKGILTRKKPSSSHLEDIRFGWKMARAVGSLDIGQCVVVRDRTVLAVEAIEGTDAAIKRGGKLAGKKAVVVKVKKPNQDFRFDLPSIGKETIESMKNVKASVLAVEAGQALLFDKENVIKLADKAGIIIVGFAETKAGIVSYK